MYLSGSSGRYPYHEGKHLIVSVDLWADGDESGLHENAKYCIVSGYIGSPRQWKLLVREWQALLATSHVSDFHASEFFGRDENGLRLGQYKGWDDDQADTFLGAILEIIHRRRVYPIGAAVEIDAFNGFTYGERRFLTNGLLNRATDKWLTTGAPSKPYHFAIQFFWSHALSHAEKGARVHFVLDRQNVLQSGILQFMATIKSIWDDPAPSHPGLFGDIIYGSRLDHVPLQAADLHTYGWQTELVRGRTMNRERRIAMDSLTKKKRSMYVANQPAIEHILSERIEPEFRARLRAEPDPSL